MTHLLNDLSKDEIEIYSLVLASSGIEFTVLKTDDLYGNILIAPAEQVTALNATRPNGHNYY